MRDIASATTQLGVKERIAGNKGQCGALGPGMASRAGGRRCVLPIDAQHAACYRLRIRYLAFLFVRTSGISRTPGFYTVNVHPQMTDESLRPIKPQRARYDFENARSDAGREDPTGSQAGPSRTVGARLRRGTTLDGGAPRVTSDQLCGPHATWTDGGAAEAVGGSDTTLRARLDDRRAGSRYALRKISRLDLSPACRKHDRWYTAGDCPVAGSRQAIT